MQGARRRMADYSQVPASLRLAGGRRRYNHQRQALADMRRLHLLILARPGVLQWELAEDLGVSPSTISRDLARLRRHGWQRSRCK